ncbi:hypothetical protein C7M61_001995 [Candidozyma pseudohaemuli]|uniref:C2H2-type domain-containing protein n=1 Tax=Candidozyma pseudohaemuli TaxID=418784 RepID=A0A2P7YTT6_9ASCO|nr:hypothetical protein C7M61_001995 [[Candida] pseudohaemulonii]PSK39384.1 hypothetical protein C7M61_001995 [[Candida] pseudohaemulonii]
MSNDTTKGRSRVSKPKPGKQKKEENLPSNENSCIICAEAILYSAVSPCNNVTCHLCCFRQRALYERNTCLVCRTEHPQVVFTDQVLEPEAKYTHFEDLSKTLINDKYGIRFTSEDAQNATMLLLEQKCTMCDETFPKFKELADHTKNTHNKEYCSICASHRKAFTSELKLYTRKQLQRHLQDGDVEGFTGHPRCKFCRNKQFYSEDELNIHIRDSHERCYICDQDQPRQSAYYRNYDHLYEHFKDFHYVCSVPSCVEKRFVVFREDLDLTAHMLKEHGGLTGHNGRVVIGAGYQSQLSTFSQNHRPRPQPQQDSMDTKRRRLEERAKHYLNSNEEDMARFADINQAYKSKRIDALRLISDYEALFKVPELDLSLLVYELAELYPQSSDQRQQLHSVYLSKYPASPSSSHAASPGLTEKFPVLGNGSLSSISLSLWAPSQLKKTQNELFPRLPKPAKPTVVKNDQPVRYVKMKKPQPKPSVTVNNFQGNSSFRPTYLESQRLSSASSFPSLNGSASSSNANLRSNSPMVSASPKLSDKSFPALAKKTTKKEIPRVNPVNNGLGSWGTGLAQPTPKPTEDFGIPIIDKKAEKLRRKQERAQRK